jgi:hypothetical protein
MYTNWIYDIQRCQKTYPKRIGSQYGASENKKPKMVKVRENDERKSKGILSIYTKYIITTLGKRVRGLPLSPSLVIIIPQKIRPTKWDRIFFPIVLIYSSG